MELKEWIVTLHKKEDLEGFYEDMETPGGNLFIPDRKVEVANRRLISRNTHYMLTFEEAELIKADSRVMGVDLKELVDNSIRPLYNINNGLFNKGWNNSANDINWGLLRQSESSNRSNWGDNGTSAITDNLTITSSGKNVDIVIVDGHIDPDHPEFAVNSDGSGGSRVTQFNWFSLTSLVTGGSNGTYVYDRAGSYTDPLDADDNNHGCHCAGTAAGNTQGWARDANIYNISPYGSNPNSLSTTVLWDYIRAWHNAKPINPATGRRNPTITNNSYGSVITVGDGQWGPATQITYRGVTFNPGRELTPAELQQRGCYAPTVNIEFPTYFTSRQVDMQDAIDDGIIIVAAAGNDRWRIVSPQDQDYNNTMTLPIFGNPVVSYYNRGTGSGAGYAPVITVGAVSNNREEDKASFSNTGSGVDVFAAGEAIQSSLHSGGAITDPRNSSYTLGKSQGTSMACPQVAGIIALLAESWPNITQAEAQDWIISNANSEQMFDTDTDDPMDLDSLQGAANLFARWVNQRVISGNTFPQKNFRPRPTSGATYPRPRIRRRG